MIRGRVIGLALLVALAATSTHSLAVTIRVSQESSAGAGDYNANVLGYITAYGHTGTIADFYQYGAPNGASYNGEANGGPLPISDRSLSFFVLASDGLNFVTVHDKPNDGDGGVTSMRTDLVGTTGAYTVVDDTVVDPPSVEGSWTSGGGATLWSRKRWADCCTDGFAIGDLTGMTEVFTEIATAQDFRDSLGFNIPTGEEDQWNLSGITDWYAMSSDGGSIELQLDAKRGVRFDFVPEPAPFVLAGIGLLGVLAARRRRS